MLSKQSLPTLKLREGSMAVPSMVHNGGWYNSKGDKLGWGDLGPRHFKSIQKGLQPGELLIVLGEHDSFWNFVTHTAIVGALCATDPKEQNPGVQYLVEKARWCISKDAFYWVSHTESGEWNDISYKPLNRETLAKMLAEAI